MLLVTGRALALAAAVYIVVQQHHYRYPSVFEWPTLFPLARTLAWIAVVFLAADAMVEHRARPARAPSRAARTVGEDGRKEPAASTGTR